MYRSALLSTVLLSAFVVIAQLVCALTPRNWFDSPRADTIANAAIPSMRIVQRLPRPPNVTGLAWSPDGSKLATFSDYTTLITIWDVSDWHIIREFRRNSNSYPGNNFVWLPAGLILAAAAARTSDEERYSLTLFDPNSGMLVKNILGPSDVRSLRHNQASVFAATKDGSFVAMSTFLDAYDVFILDTHTWSIIATLEPLYDDRKNGITTALSFSPDNHLAVGSASGKIEIFDIARNLVERTITAFPSKQSRGISTVAFSPDGAFVAAAPQFSATMQPLDQGPVRIWKVDNGAQVAALEGTEETETFRQVSWSADGSLLSAISHSGLFSIWSVGTALPSSFRIRFPSAGTATEFSSTGQLAAAVGDEVIVLK